MDQINLHATMNAKVWAQEFMRIWKDHGFANEWIDEGLMIGWFANSIMCGWDHAHYKLAPPKPRED